MGHLGQKRRARSLAWSARQHRQLCEGAWTPLLEDLAAPGLTTREHEVAHLAATGLTSREIAERLGVSVRTVDNQLHAVYTKLGVRSRRDLAALLKS